MKMCNKIPLARKMRSSSFLFSVEEDRIDHWILSLFKLLHARKRGIESSGREIYLTATTIYTEK